MWCLKTLLYICNFDHTQGTQSLQEKYTGVQGGDVCSIMLISHIISSYQCEASPNVVCGMTGTSSAEDAMAVGNTQLQVHKLMQEFALSRPGLLPGVLAPPGGALLPLAAHAGPGPNEQLALVPVMIQNPDGSFTGAYQVQPYPSGFSTDSVPPELPGVLPPMPAVNLCSGFYLSNRHTSLLVVGSPIFLPRHATPVK